MDGKITALKAQKRNRNRISVYLDGEYAFGLSRIVAAWLQIGQDLDEARIAELKAQDAGETAFQRALRLLNHRDRSESEITERLREQSVPEENITEVIERLRRSELVNDQRFAETWVENRSEFRPRSRRALTYELRGKGISPDTIQDVLDSFQDEKAAYAAAQKYSQRLKQLEWPEFRQKVCAFLARRGFNYATAIDATGRVWAELGDKNPGQDEPLYKEVDL